MISPKSKWKTTLFEVITRRKWQIEGLLYSLEKQTVKTNHFLMRKSGFESFENGRNTHKSWAKQTDFLINLTKITLAKIKGEHDGFGGLLNAKITMKKNKTTVF